MLRLLSYSDPIQFAAAFGLRCVAVYNGKAEQNPNRAKTHTSAQTTFLLTGTAVSTFLRLLRCVARATFLHRHSGLCNFLSRSFVTFRCFCAPARRTRMARRDTVKTHTSAQTALLSTGTAVSTFFCVLCLLRDAQKRVGIQIWQLKASKTHFFVNEFLIGRARPPEPDFWTRLLDRGQKLQFRSRSARIGADFC